MVVKSIALAAQTHLHDAASYWRVLPGTLCGLHAVYATLAPLHYSIQFPW